MLSAGDTERIERALKRSIFRRGVTVEDFSEIYNLAINVKTDPSVGPIFKARKTDL